ncbi:MAG: glutamate--cysteine ligase [Pseudomonadota bacterium]
MGQEIATSTFTEADRVAFRKRLRDETATLKRWFQTDAFDRDDARTVGLEIEGWLMDADVLPAPENEAFFAAVKDPDVVAELSKFNFEINAPARPLRKRVFNETRSDIERTWTACRDAAAPLGLKPMAVGIAPTVRDDMLQPSWMSEGERYRALNRELLRRREDRPILIDIEGDDRLRYRCDHIMLEAACTSLQAHFKVNQDEAVRFYNAGVLSAGPLVAACANSPFLYGKSLWDETRIRAFEQATATDVFRDAQGRKVQRVSLGRGYLRQSFLELFVENLSFPTLLPMLHEESARLPHVRLHNGVIWRWVRPILGFDADDNPHLRIEHRVTPAGPSVVDMVANLALCHGLMLALGRAETPPETETPFEDARANFYACAKHGLAAEVKWRGRAVNVQTLLSEELLPAAASALAREDVDAGDRAFYVDAVLHERLRTGRTGAAWQRSFVACNGPDFQALTAAYLERQESGEPVHEWAV